MNYLTTVMMALTIIVYGSSHAVRITTLQDELKRMARKKAPTVETEEVKPDTDFVAKEYCFTKFKRSEKLYKHAKEKQNYKNTKRTKSSWKRHYQKQKKHLLHYITSYR